MVFLKYTLSLISQRLLNIIRCECGCDNCLQNKINRHLTNTKDKILDRLKKKENK